MMATALEELRRRMHPVPEGRYLIGFSGGADSTALLMLLKDDIRTGRIRAEAVHINHGLRGSEADEDEQFCRKICDDAGIPLSVYHAELKGRTDEAAARKERFRYFRQRYREYSADGLILAHHADDQAETFLMRLIRGAGPDGLECMKQDETVDSIRILRPLLSMHRDEIRNALRADEIPWREDSSNETTAYLRNRIRAEVLPALNRISGSAADRICRAAGLIGQDNEELNRQAGLLLDTIAKGRLMNAEALAGESEAIRSRVLRMWWQRHAPAMKEHALSAEQTDAFEELLHRQKGTVNLPGPARAVRDGKYLFLQTAEEEPPAPVTVTGPITDFGLFRLTESPPADDPGDGKRTQEVPEGFTRGCVIRTRMPGDRIRPFGMTGSKKLQDYLTDRRVSEPFRDMIPLLCRGQEVLLVCGVGAGSIPARDSGQPRVRLTWEGEMPWMT